MEWTVKKCVTGVTETDFKLIHELSVFNKFWKDFKFKPQFFHKKNSYTNIYFFSTCEH